MSQRLPSEAIALPANKTDASLTLSLPSDPPKGATPRISFVNVMGVPLSPQPIIKDPVTLANPLTIQLTDVHFFGPAKLQVKLDPGPTYTYTLQRGPRLSESIIGIESRSRSQIWLYNFDTQPLSFRWRMVSGADSVCGIQSTGQAALDCNANGQNWPQVTIGAAQSDPVDFIAPDSWFDPWNGDSERKAELELRFGTDEAAPMQRFPLELKLHNHLSEVFTLWFPPWLGSAFTLIENLFFVTIGAVLLMLAQVMIPNFRKCLQMESQLENLQERLRAIGSRVGDRLYTRCHQELESLRLALAVAQASAATKARSFIWDKLALSGNSTEVNRLAGLVTRIESRIRLTERLDQVQSITVDRDLPPSIFWNCDKQILSVQAVLSRQFVSDAEEKAASTMLDVLNDPDGSLKDFAADLETRITALRRQFAAEPWKGSYLALVKNLPGSADLLKDTPDPVPDGGWSPAELAQRDLASFRLVILYQLIALNGLLDDPTKNKILNKLESRDPAKLASAKTDLLEVSQGFSEQSVRDALAAELWDVFSEPVTVTDQDVLRLSFIFGNKDLNRSAAKDTFQCYWKITPDRATGADDDVYEQGWEIQFIPLRGKFTITPQVYDAEGKPVTIRTSTDPTKTNKGVTTIQVDAPSSNVWHARVLRGLLEAGITALVPVITVALTQVQAGVGVDRLVLLGFTSQAIRAAVVPESVTPPPEAPPKTTT